jgi:hypothetical protein
MTKKILLTSAIAFCALFSSQCLRAEDTQQIDDESYSMSIELKKVIDGQPSELISSSELPIDSDEVARVEISAKDKKGEKTTISAEVNPGEFAN